MRTLLTTLALLAASAGCGPADPPIHDPDRPAHGPPPTVIASWSQSADDADDEWLAAHIEPMLMESDAERDRFLGSLPPPYADEAAVLRTVDLSRYTLLVAGFRRCGNVAEVQLADGVVLHTVRRTDEIACDWSPTEVQVFRVTGTGLSLGSSG